MFKNVQEFLDVILSRVIIQSITFWNLRFMILCIVKIERFCIGGYLRKNVNYLAFEPRVENSK